MFGAGRRVCLGEALGKNRLFLFAVSLLQRFTFLQSEERLPDLDPRTYQLGIVLHPEKFTLKAVKRHQNVDRCDSESYKEEAPHIR